MSERYFENETFEGIVLEEERLDGYQFVDCTFQKCSLKGCKLIQCMFTGCTFDGCNISDLKTEASCVNFAEFFDCDIQGIHWNELLPTGRFGQPISRFQSCRLRYNTFSQMNFRKFQFADTMMIGSTFSECDMVEINFRRSKLERTEFMRCDLRKADFRDATGYQIDILTCKLKGAKFSLPDAMNLLNGLEITIDC